MGFLNFLGWILLLLLAVRLEADSDHENRVFLRAQCKAMCLQYFGHSDDAAIKRVSWRIPCLFANFSLLRFFNRRSLLQGFGMLRNRTPCRFGQDMSCLLKISKLFLGKKNKYLTRIYALLCVMCRTLFQSNSFLFPEFLDCLAENKATVRSALFRLTGSRLDILRKLRW